MASGSLKQYLNVTYDEKLDSQADDVEGTLFKFVPTGKLEHSCLYPHVTFRS